MFRGVEYDPDAMGKAMTTCFVVWLIWTVITFWFTLNHDEDLEEASGKKLLVSIFGGGLAFIMLSSILLLIEFHLAFSNAKISHTEQISTSKTMFLAFTNLLIAGIIIGIIGRVTKETGTDPNDTMTNADVIWISSGAVSFLGMGLLWLGIHFMPKVYTAATLYSLHSDVKDFIIGIIVLPIVIILFMEFLQWTLG